MGTNEERKLSGLVELDGSSLSGISEDISGWSVCTEDGMELGEVHTLIGEPETARVRYIDVDVPGEKLGRVGEQHLLVPIGTARIEREEERIVLGRLSSLNIQEVPQYQPTSGITREYEQSLRRSYEPGYTPEVEGVGESFYGSELYDDSRLRTGAGGSMSSSSSPSSSSLSSGSTGSSSSSSLSSGSSSSPSSGSSSGSLSSGSGSSSSSSSSPSSGSLSSGRGSSSDDSSRSGSL
jgi:hypothetical protein